MEVIQLEIPFGIRNQTWSLLKSTESILIFGPTAIVRQHIESEPNYILRSDLVTLNLFGWRFNICQLRICSVHFCINMYINMQQTEHPNKFILTAAKSAASYCWVELNN